MSRAAHVPRNIYIYIHYVNVRREKHVGHVKPPRPSSSSSRSRECRGRVISTPAGRRYIKSVYCRRDIIARTTAPYYSRTPFKAHFIGPTYVIIAGNSPCAIWCMSSARFRNARLDDINTSVKYKFHCRPCVRENEKMYPTIIFRPSGTLYDIRTRVSVRPGVSHTSTDYAWLQLS